MIPRLLVAVVVACWATFAALAVARGRPRATLRERVDLGYLMLGAALPALALALLLWWGGFW